MRILRWLYRWWDRGLHECQFCGKDTRSPECCGIRYYSDRMDIP